MPTKTNWINEILNGIATVARADRVTAVALIVCTMTVAVIYILSR